MSNQTPAVSPAAPPAVPSRTAAPSVPSAACAAPKARAPRNALGVLERLDGPDVKVYPNRCVEVRNRNAGCHACADACASGAISVVDGLLSVDASRCIGCGTCATVCPTCALEARHPEDDDLLARLVAALDATGGEVAVACTRKLDAAFGSYDERKVVEVTCLGRVDESLVAALAERGCERLTLVGHRCASCEHVAGFRAAEAVCESASSLLEAWGSPIEIAVADELPACVRTAAPFAAAIPGGATSDLAIPDGAPARRASSLRSGGEPAFDGASEDAAGADAEPERVLPQKVGRDGTLPHHVPTRRGRLLASLNALGAPSETTVSSRLWGTVSIDTDACGSCRLCAVFCPTGALAKFDDRATGVFGIEHTPAKCVKCRCCADICPKGAISITEEIFAPDIVDGHVERFEMRPREIEPGKPATVVKTMRKLLSDSKFVNFA